MRSPEPLLTRRLCLVPATAELVLAELDSPVDLAAALGAEVPEGWPPEALREVLPLIADVLAEYPWLVGWETWYWLTRPEPGGRPRLVGCGGFKGPPDDGLVEIGYGTDEGSRNLGYATEAVSALVRWAFTQPGVQGVAAEALPDNLPSLRVLARCGFRPAGPALEPGHLRFLATTPP